MTESDAMQIRIQRAHLDLFIIVHPTYWDTMLKVDRKLSYNFGIREVTESNAMQTWIQRAHIDRFIIVHPKYWDTFLKADRTLPYNFGIREVAESNANMDTKSSY